MLLVMLPLLMLLPLLLPLLLLLLVMMRLPAGVLLLGGTVGLVIVWRRPVTVMLAGLSFNIKPFDRLCNCGSLILCFRCAG